MPGFVEWGLLGLAALFFGEDVATVDDGFFGTFGSGNARKLFYLWEGVAQIGAKLGFEVRELQREWTADDDCIGVVFFN